MSGPTLHYVYDPLCGWCYAAAPLVEAARGAGLVVAMHGGGLFEPAVTLAPERSGAIRSHDRRIADLTGLPFGPAYTEGVLGDATAILWSRPTIAGVLATDAVEAGAGLRMLRAIQDAHYVSGRRVVEPEVLADLAEGLGLDREAFGRSLDDAAAGEHIRRTRGWMQALGLQGFPSFLVGAGGELARVRHEPFYGRPDAFAREVSDLAARFDS